MTILSFCAFAFDGFDAGGQASDDLIQDRNAFVDRFGRQKKLHSAIASLAFASFPASDLEMLRHFLVEAAAIPFFDVGAD